MKKVLPARYIELTCNNCDMCITIGVESLEELKGDAESCGWLHIDREGMDSIDFCTDKCYAEYHELISNNFMDSKRESIEELIDKCLDRDHNIVRQKELSSLDAYDIGRLLLYVIRSRMCGNGVVIG